MAVDEGRWYCRSCGVRNQGADTRCLCGHPRGKDEEIVPKSHAPAIAAPAVLVAASAGPHWVCGSCGAENAHAVCEKCGVTRTPSSDGPKAPAAEPRREVERSTGMRVRDEPTEAMARWPFALVAQVCRLWRGLSRPHYGRVVAARGDEGGRCYRRRNELDSQHPDRPARPEGRGVGPAVGRGGPPNGTAAAGPGSAGYRDADP